MLATVASAGIARAIYGASFSPVGVTCTSGKSTTHPAITVSHLLGREHDAESVPEELPCMRCGDHHPRDAYAPVKVWLEPSGRREQRRVEQVVWCPECRDEIADVLATEQR